MKQLTCEMCGSTELVKQDGYFVCQTCGTKYSVEEAKKMMIEGTVEVEGTVKVDSSDELKNLYILARRSLYENYKQSSTWINTNEAVKYYEQIIVRDPNSVEAIFFTTYTGDWKGYSSYRTYNSSMNVMDSEEPLFNYIKENITNPEEQRKMIEVVVAKLSTISRVLHDGYYRDHISLNPLKNNSVEARKEFVKNLGATRDILYKAGDVIINVFGDIYGDIAAKSWDEAIIYHKGLMRFADDEQQNADIIKKYAGKISKYNPSYSLPQQSSKSGCYVATCVYGSYDCPEVWTLRRFRDDTLGSTWYGRLFIRTYYAISPTLVKWFGNTNWFKKLWKGKLDRMVAKLQANGIKDTPYEDKKW